MNISNPRYTSVQGYPILELDIDNKPHRISWEQKPTLVRHGMVAIGGKDVSSTLPDGRVLTGVSDDPQLFRLATAFGLSCYHNRLKEGPASEDVDPEELAALGQRLADFAFPESPSWEAIAERMQG